MSLAFKKLPNDPFFEEMDPLMYMWLFENWDAKISRERDVLRNAAILVGSFFNPEAANKMLETNIISTSDEEFDELVENIIGKKDIQERLSRRKRRVLKKVNDGRRD